MTTNQEIKNSFLHNMKYKAVRQYIETRYKDKNVINGNITDEQSPLLSYLNENYVPGGGALANIYTTNYLYRVYGELSSYLDDLIKITEKLKFTSSVEDWKKYYVFPKSFTGSQAHPHAYVNESESVACKWLEHFLASLPHSQGYTNPEPALIVGPVGSGKSSFIKYMLIVHNEKFSKKKVIPVRIELSTVKKRLKTKHVSNYESQIRSLGLSRMVRDSIYYLVFKGWLGNYHNNHSDDQKEKFLNLLLIKYRGTLYETAIKKDIDHIGTYIDSVMECDPNKALLDSLSENILSMVIEFIRSIGYIFLIIYDGFDAISANDHFTKESPLDLLKIVASAARDPSFYSTVGHDRFNTTPRCYSLISLRGNTFRYFCQEWTREYGGDAPIPYVIAPPTFHELITQRAEHQRPLHPEFTNHDHLKWSNKIFINAYLSVARHVALILNGELPTLATIGISDLYSEKGYDIISIFNGDTRTTLMFFRSLLLFMFHKAARDSGYKLSQTTPTVASMSRYVESFFTNSHQFLSFRPYMYRKLLLVGSGNSFHNFCRLEAGKIILGDFSRNVKSNISAAFDEQRSPLLRNDQCNGYCDNPYMYHERYEHFGSPSLFLKIRILQILNIDHRTSVQETTIISRLRDWFGLNLSKVDLHHTISVMIYAGFVSVESITDIASFRIESFGKCMLEHNLHKLEFVEHIITRTLLPPAIRDCLKHDENGAGLDSTREWQINSISNFYVFLLYANWVEEKENANAATHTARQDRDLQIPNWKISVRMAGEIDSVNRMINHADDGIDEQKTPRESEPVKNSLGVKAADEISNNQNRLLRLFPSRE